MNNIQKVIYNNPATIILWNDGTKTIAKCSNNDTFDPEKGLLVAMAKKYIGSKNMHKVFKNFLPVKDTNLTEQIIIHSKETNNKTTYDGFSLFLPISYPTFPCIEIGRSDNLINSIIEQTIK